MATVSGRQESKTTMVSQYNRVFQFPELKAHAFVLRGESVLMSTTKEITIFIAEDHLISRMGLKMLLEQTSHFNVIGEAEDGQSAVENILKLKPDVVMMDLGMPKVDGVAATEMIKKELPETKILIFTTAEDDESVFKALKAGADGYCLKTISGELLATAIQSVLSGAAWLDPGIAHKVLRAQMEPQPKSGASPLTQSKLQLLELVEKGKSLEEIASELRVNDSLVKGLLNELLGQLKGDLSDPTTISKSIPKEKQSATGISPGDLIAGHYQVEDRIGHGGMGSVFKARHTHIDRKVAVKTLHEHLASDKSVMDRFKAEAEASAAIVHQNLITIYDFGLHEGKVPYMVLEYLDGFDLSDLIREVGKLDEETATNIVIQVCDALTAVHAKGIVHRDLKPSNIMLIESNDNPYFVKVVDFGIAKVLDGAKVLTQTGEAIGSPPYMSPEQCFAKPIDHRSDLYSLGCVMYEVYSGSRLFGAGTVCEVMMKHVNEMPDLEVLTEAKVSKGIIELIAELLQKDPEKRPASANSVRQTLLKH